jgi:two-component system, NtrC family, sensor kinase
MEQLSEEKKSSILIDSTALIGKKFPNTGEYWKKIIEGLPDFVFIVNLEHEIIYMNQPMLDYLGITSEEALGKLCYHCIHQKSCIVDNCLQERMLQDGKSHLLDLFDKRLGGHVEVRIFPYWITPGDILGSVHIVRNINERIQALEEKEKLQRQLLHAQKLESVGQLASGIAHEINTPVQFINTNINFIEESFTEIEEYINLTFDIFEGNLINKNNFEKIRPKIKNFDWEFLKEEIPKAIEQSKDGLQRVTSIVQAMKSFSHPGGQGKTESDINRIIMTTITVSRNEWKYVSTIETDLDPNIHPVWCDANAISQVILNILINAAHAIENKLGRNPVGNKGMIKISTAQKDNYIDIRISDSGSGIPKEIHSRIFDPFFTTKEVGRGTGQGLAIAHDVIYAKHNGKMTFETQQDIGTTFIIELPNSSGFEA